MKTKERLILSKEDFDIIMVNIKGAGKRTGFSQQEADELEEELKGAKIVSNDEFPPDVVRLNSVVTVKEEVGGKVLKITLVPPPKADIKKMHISVLSPIGTALIGYRKGSRVSWKVPAGQKTFTILDVENNFP